MRIVPIAVVVAIALVGTAHAQVPAPAFDPLVPSGYTMYVDPSSPTATDASNPSGTPARPRRSIPNPIPAGTVVELHGVTQLGTATGTLTALGTAAAPVVVKGIGAVVSGQVGARVTLAGSNLVWAGTKWDKVAVVLTASNVVFSGNEVSGHSPAGNSSAVAAAGAGQVIRANHIHHNGDSESAKEIDVHGIKVVTGARGVWIDGNEIDHNGGDAIQIGEASAPEPWAQGVFISSNSLHEDRENAVDVKKARDVVIVRNIAYGYKERSSSAGEAIVVHNQPERVWVLENVIAASVRGISYTGVSTFVVAGNLLLGIVHNPSNTYDPSSLYGSFAISGRDSANILIANNTAWACDGGISMQSGLLNVGVINNAVQAAHQALAGTSGLTTEQANVWDATAADFANPAGSNFGPISARLVHKGIDSVAFKAYALVYGVAIDSDLYGTKASAPPSIGAAEPQ